MRATVRLDLDPSLLAHDTNWGKTWAKSRLSVISSTRFFTSGASIYFIGIIRSLKSLTSHQTLTFRELVFEELLFEYFTCIKLHFILNRLIEKDGRFIGAAAGI